MKTAYQIFNKRKLYMLQFKEKSSIQNEFFLSNTLQLKMAFYQELLLLQQSNSRETSVTPYNNKYIKYIQIQMTKSIQIQIKSFQSWVYLDLNLRSKKLANTVRSAHRWSLSVLREVSICSTVHEMRTLGYSLQATSMMEIKIINYEP